MTDDQHDDRRAHRPFAVASTGQEFPRWLTTVLSWSLATRVALSLILLALVGLLDVATGFEISCGPFYLVPVRSQGLLCPVTPVALRPLPAWRSGDITK